MNQYRCENGCKYNDNGYCEKEDCPVSFSDYSTILIYGCTFHSDFQSERDKVLDEFAEWVDSLVCDGYIIKQLVANFKQKYLRQQAGEP
jgi:hypothetical protein